MSSDDLSESSIVATVDLGSMLIALLMLQVPTKRSRSSINLSLNASESDKHCPDEHMPTGSLVQLPARVQPHQVFGRPSIQSLCCSPLINVGHLINVTHNFSVALLLGVPSKVQFSPGLFPSKPNRLEIGPSTILERVMI